VLQGPDAAAFLHNMCTNEVRQLRPGEGRETFFPNSQAKVIGHGYLFRSKADEIWLDLPPGQADPLACHLEHFHITEQFDLANRTDDWAQFHVAGPKAFEIVEKIVPRAPELSNDLFEIVGEIHGRTCRVRRNDFLSVPGFDLLLSSPGASEWSRLLTQHGAVSAGMHVYHQLRVEAGTPLYGVDIDETNLPQEVGRTERAISFTKGCYIGQETIARIRTYGHVNRSLVGIQFQSDKAAAAGAKIWRDDKDVGHVTSSVFSPRRKSAIALGYVRRGSNEVGTQLDVDIEGGKAKAEIVGLPLV
jgi:folate-binding protein YgfZ